MAATRNYRGPLAHRQPSQRVGTYTRVSMYVLLGMNPFFVLASVAPCVAPGAALAVSAAAITVCAAMIVLLRRGIARYLGGPPVSGRVFCVTLGATGLAIAATLVALPARSFDATLFDGDWRTLCVTFDLMCVALALTPLLILRWIALMSVGVAVAAMLATLPAAEGCGCVSQEYVIGFAIGTFLSVSMMTFFVGLSGRLSIWMLGVVHEMERTRVAHAQLAVAEERLRFSRDLHDVFGRTLSVVAVKSELAAELSARGRSGAAEEMLEVRQIAQDALREVREVVAGYRKADLAAELVGARSVLRSAGIDTTVYGADALVAARAQESLAWVVREGTTNVVRHSDATWCSIQLTATARDITLEIVNDGAHPAGKPGSGLAGLTERLAALGGRLSTWLDGDRFGLVASVPLGDEQPSPSRRVASAAPAHSDSPLGGVPSTPPDADPDRVGDLVPTPDARSN